MPGELKAIPTPKDPRWGDLASTLRNLADKAEAGELTEVLVVANNRERQCYESLTHFDDRWRLLGAIEYAKQKVCE